MAPNRKGEQMIIIVSVLVGLAIISTSLRICARLKRRAGFGVDDYLCFIAVLLMIGMLIELVLWCTIGGNGYPMAEVDHHTLELFYKIFLSNQFTYFALTPVIKISIICFYRRLFTTRTFLRATFALNCLLAAWAAGIFLACAFQCRPLRAYWDHSVEGHCFDGYKFFIVNQSFNVMMDFVILGLPIPMIWSLHRSWQDRLGLNLVFALGGFVCFASIYRIVVLFYIDPLDITYTIYDATLWTHVEPSIGLVVSCLPIIRGLFPRVKPTRSSQQKAHSRSSQDQLPVESSLCMPDYDYASSSQHRVWCDGEEIKKGTQNRERNSTGPKKITVRTDIEVGFT